MNVFIKLMGNLGHAFNAFLSCVITTYGTMGSLHGATAVFVVKDPVCFRDGIFLIPKIPAICRQELFSERHPRVNALDRVGIAEITDWCNRVYFQVQLTMHFETIHLYTYDAEGGGVTFSGLAHAVIDLTHDADVILGNYANSVRPSGWSGNLADIIARHCQPFEELTRDDRPAIRGAA